MEIACWTDGGFEQVAAACDRVYFGHETCQERLPTRSVVDAVAEFARDRQLRVTFVTPLLTNEGMTRARRIIDQLAGLLHDFEVVCSDWGLLFELARQATARPVVGRLLAAQPSDPRVMRILQCDIISSHRLVEHLDGTVCELRHKPPSAPLANHLRGCWLDKPSVTAFLGKHGVHRCELSNVGQGLLLTRMRGWSYSLYVPDVLVTVMRHCPGRHENLVAGATGCPAACDRGDVPWTTPGMPVDLYRRDNALYYRSERLPRNLHALPIDRIVYQRVR